MCWGWASWFYTSLILIDMDVRMPYSLRRLVLMEYLSPTMEVLSLLFFLSGVWHWKIPGHDHRKTIGIVSLLSPIFKVVNRVLSSLPPMETLYALRRQRPEIFDQMEGMNRDLPYFFASLMKGSVYWWYVKHLSVRSEPSIKPTSGGVRRGTGERTWQTVFRSNKIFTRRCKSCLFRCEGRRSWATISLCTKRKFHLYG